MFATNALWKGSSSIGEIDQNVPVAELLPGGQFTERWHAWLAKGRFVKKVFARLSSFTELTEIVRTGHAAAVRPDLAQVDFDPKRYTHRPIPALRKRTHAVLIGRELLWELQSSWLDNFSWADAWTYVFWERFESIRTRRGFGGFVSTFGLKSQIFLEVTS